MAVKTDGGGGTHETEIKLRVDSAVEARARLTAGGFEEARARGFESNVLLDTAEGRLRSRGEVLRVRQFGGKAVITFKGPASSGGRHKTREEIETESGDWAATLRIFSRLGYEPTYRYEKYRTEFARPGESGVATLDETPIGVFLELEGEPEWIDRMAAALGFGESDYVTNSYASLYQQFCERRGVPVGPGMVFQGTP